jgi:hypothetical protein
MGLGSEIQDPEKLVLDPRSRGQKGTGSRSATLSLGINNRTRSVSSNYFIFTLVFSLKEEFDQVYGT